MKSEARKCPTDIANDLATKNISFIQDNMMTSLIKS